jgi:hypothetical protein
MYKKYIFKKILKENILFFEIEKYFDFLKMDKKNVQKPIAKTLLTDEIFCLDS